MLHDPSREPAVGGQVEIARLGPEDLALDLLHRLLQLRGGEPRPPGRGPGIVGVSGVPEPDLARRADVQSVAVDIQPAVTVR